MIVLVFRKTLLVLYLLISIPLDMRKLPSLTHCRYSVCVPSLIIKIIFLPSSLGVKHNHSLQLPITQLLIFQLLRVFFNPVG